jgi:hypothetical protein
MPKPSTTTHKQNSRAIKITSAGCRDSSPIAGGVYRDCLQKTKAADAAFDQV